MPVRSRSSGAISSENVGKNWCGLTTGSASAGSSIACSHRKPRAGVAVEQRVAQTAEADQPERELDHVLLVDLDGPEADALECHGHDAVLLGVRLLQEVEQRFLDDASRRRAARPRRRPARWRTRSRWRRRSCPRCSTAPRVIELCSPSLRVSAVCSWSVALPAAACSWLSVSMFASRFFRSVVPSASRVFGGAPAQVLWRSCAACRAACRLRRLRRCRAAWRCWC